MAMRQRGEAVPTGEAPDRWRIAPTAVALAGVAVLSKVMGFGEKIVIAHYFGTTDSADTYFVATGVFFSAVFLVKELVHPTLLPTLNQALTVSQSTFCELFARMFRWVVLVLLVAVAAGVLLMTHAASLVAPGFGDAQRSELTLLLRQLLPAGATMGLMAVTYTTLNAKGRLVVASLAEAAFKAVLLVGAALLIPLGGLQAIPLAMLVGAAVCLGIHLAVLRPPGVMAFHRSGGGSRLLRRTATLMLPIVIGVIFSHISDLVDNLLASRLPEGQLSYLSYGKKITDAILLAGPTALATVLYARASRLASLSRGGELAAMIAKGLRLLLFLSVPVGCLMILLRRPIVRALFEHGRFNPISTAGVAGGLLVYGLGIIALSLEGLSVYSFYAMSDTRTPVTAGVLCVLLDIGLAVLLVGPMAYQGIAAALVIAKSVKVAALLILLHRKLGGRLIDSAWGPFTARLVGAGAGVWLLLVVLARWLGRADGPRLLLLAVVCLVAVLFYAGLGHLLGLQEPRLLVARVPWRRLLAFRRKANQ